MTPAERLALALLRGGFSYDDAARQAKLTLGQVKDLWRRHGRLTKADPE